MSKSRYICEHCGITVERDGRSIMPTCRICKSYLSFLWGVKVVKGTLYNEGTYWEEELVVPEGVTKIEFGAFKGSKMKSVRFPKSLQKIGAYAFRDCSNLEEVVIPEGVKEIDSNTFDGCSNLKRLVLPKTIGKIASSAFEGCRSLKTVILPEGVESIDSGAFSACSSLKFIALPSTLKKIGTAAFDNDSSRTTAFRRAVLPVGITEMEENVFGGDEDHIEFFAGKSTYAESFLKKQGLSYRLLSSKTGFVVGKEIVNNTLYYWEKPQTSITVPKQVNVIEAYAFAYQSKVKKVVFSNSVTEIHDFAFQGCVNLSEIVFNKDSALTKIGTKAFDGFAGTLVDLPATVVDIAPDAFPKNCIISVGGEMPSYAAKLEALEMQRKAIAEKISEASRIAAEFASVENSLSNHLSSVPKYFDEIPVLTKQYHSTEAARNEAISRTRKERDILCGQLDAIKREMQPLTEARAKCFFLAISKKKALDEAILQKQSELLPIQTELQKLDEASRAEEKRFSDALASIKKKLNELTEKKQDWEAKKAVFTKRRDTLAAKSAMLSAEIDDLNEKLSESEKALEKEHKEWLKEKEKAELQRKIEKEKAELLTEKTKLLSKLQLPRVPAIPTFQFVPRETIIDEELLNEALLSMINDLNEQSRVSAHNSYVIANAEKIDRVKEINASLGCETDETLAEFVAQPAVGIRDTYIPERFRMLCELFAKTDPWKTFNQEMRDIKTKKNSKTVQHQFFSELKYIPVCRENRELLLFPCCMIIAEPKKPLAVLSYDKVTLKVQYNEEERTAENIPEYGELISERHKYVKADGTANLRYKDNPIIKTIRYSTVTVKKKSDSIILPFETYDEALQFKTAFDHFSSAITAEPMGRVYAEYARSADYTAVLAAMDNLIKEEKKRIAAEKQREADEKKRQEEERIAAETAAIVKRQEIIERQRRINEERKQEAAKKAAERKRIARLFDDDFEAGKKDAAQTEESASSIPFEVVGNRVISNNVFKVKIKLPEEYKTDGLVFYFVTESGQVISNKKKVSEVSPNNESVLGFVLDSGIDYTTMSACRLHYETSEGMFGDIGFKMHISFYSDF